MPRWPCRLTGNATITITAPKCVLQVNSRTSTPWIDRQFRYQFSRELFCRKGPQNRQFEHLAASRHICKPVPDPLRLISDPPSGPATTQITACGQQDRNSRAWSLLRRHEFQRLGECHVRAGPLHHQRWDGHGNRRHVQRARGQLFLTGSGAAVQLSGQADWHIVAPTDGPLPGFAIFLDANGPSGLPANASSLSGQSETISRA